MQERAQTPKVHCLGAIPLEEYLGSRVFGHARNGEDVLLAALDLLGESEVRQLDEALLVDHDILGLEVAIDDVLRVQVLQRQHDLRNVELGPAFKGRYCSSENFSLMARRLYSYPPGQYSRMK